MSVTTQSKPPVNLMFGHMGLSVNNIDVMENFYTDILGFTVTDRGLVGEMKLVFLSRDPRNHHQIALATGRPEKLPPNTINSQFGPSINQISFKMATLTDLRDILQRLQDYGVSHIMPANHGIAWSIYAHDPEGNNLEFYVDTDWYMYQPFLIPLDLTKTDDEIFKLTKNLCETGEGFEPYGEWRKNIAPRMTPFVPKSAQY